MGNGGRSAGHGAPDAAIGGKAHGILDCCSPLGRFGRGRGGGHVIQQQDSIPDGGERLPEIGLGGHRVQLAQRLFRRAGVLEQENEPPYQRRFAKAGRTGEGTHREGGGVQPGEGGVQHSQQGEAPQREVDGRVLLQDAQQLLCRCFS